ncbi:MAG TPA: Crp/Fnr family transcriptional regulator [Bacteroidales bacterium]|nr:Crp/Fnr family transcriptional regulator [Bacteroidales bacterium]
MDCSLLSGSPLFQGLIKENIEAILSETPHRIRKFRPGNIIAQSGDPVNSLIIVVRGSVKGEMVDMEGKIIKIEDIPAPGALAAAFLFGKDARFPVNVISVIHTKLLIIGKKDLLKLLMKWDTVLVNFLNMISDRTQFLSEKIRFLNFKTIRSKLAHYFLVRAGKDILSFTLDKTQNELAEFFGVARPSIARALRELEEQGIVEAKGKYIKILDKKKLRSM